MRVRHETFIERSLSRIYGHDAYGRLTVAAQFTRHFVLLVPVCHRECVLVPADHVLAVGARVIKFNRRVAVAGQILLQRHGHLLTRGTPAEIDDVAPAVCRQRALPLVRKYDVYIAGEKHTRSGEISFRHL